MITGRKMKNNLVFILWLPFLSCIIIPAAVIVNFDLGCSQFRSDLADYLAKNQIPVSSMANTGCLPGGTK